jgi:hypothetical protein
MPKISLDEMAAELGCCSKTLKKYVRIYQIPHGKLGRDMRFDAAEVWAHLKGLSIEQDAPKRDLKPAKLTRPAAARRGQPSRYSSLLGLGGHS